MTSRSLRMSIMCLVMALVAACQPPPKRGNSRIGRFSPRGGPTNFVNGQPVQTQPTSMSTQWGAITGFYGDQAFQDALYYFTEPTLGSASDDVLGYVSAQGSGGTGVVFWGRASMINGGFNSYGGGQLDGQQSVLHIEIWDSKAGQMRSDGSVNPQVKVHIGADQAGFVSASGYVQNGQVNLTFSDKTGSVYMQGAVQGQTFSGNISFSNASNGNQVIPLGRFQVATCGFFICY